MVKHLNLKSTWLNLVLAGLIISNGQSAQAWAWTDFKPDLAGLRQSIGALLAQGARQADSWVTAFTNQLLTNRQYQIATGAVGAVLTAYATYRLIKACQPAVPPLVKLQQDTNAAIEQRCQQWLKEQRVPPIQTLWRWNLPEKLQDKLNQQRIKPVLEALLAQELDLITYLDQAGKRVTNPELVASWSQRTLDIQERVIALLNKHKIDLSKIKLVLTAQPLLTRQPSVLLYASRYKPGHYLLQINLNRWWLIPNLTRPARGASVAGGIGATAGTASACAGAAVNATEQDAWQQLFDPEQTRTNLGRIGWDSTAIFEMQILRCIAQIKHQDDLQLDLVLLELQEPMLAVLAAEPATSTDKLTGILRQAERRAAEYAQLCAERADLFAMWQHSQGALAVYDQLQEFEFKYETAQYEFFWPTGYRFFNYRQSQPWQDLRWRLWAIRDGD